MSKSVMTITSLRLPDKVLRELRELGVENLSNLVRVLLVSYIKNLKSRKKEYLNKRTKALLRLEKANQEWYRVELRRAMKAEDEKVIAHYKKRVEGER